MPSERKKSHLKWAKELKADFELVFDVPQCENCGTTSPPIDIAHRKKRFDIHTKEEYWAAALLCRECHNFWEHGSHERMYEGITAIIERRS